MSQRKALVTGSSSGIGRSVAELLLSRNFHVTGVSRSTPDITGESYTHITCDLSDAFATKKLCEQLQKEFSPFDVVVLNAGLAHFEPHEQQKAENISEMIAVNFTAPLLLSKATLRGLKEAKGHLLFVLSVAGVHNSPLSGVYGATKAGLLHFARNLFDEVRKSGVRVSSILPDLTDTGFYQNLSFSPDTSSTDFHLVAEDIATQIGHLISAREGMVIQELVVRPQKLRIKKTSRQKE